jgi:beta-galactosidase
VRRRNFLESLVAGTAAVAGSSSVPSKTDVPGPRASRHHAGSARIHENFNAGWLFKRQTVSTGELGSMDRDNGTAAQIEPYFRTAYREDYDDSQWQSVNLPHTWNAYDTTDAKPGYWRGIGWYRKHFRLSPKFEAKRLFLQFEGVNSIAELWLNGHRLGEHKGGYTGFEFDITDLPRLGLQPNVLTVKVDNLYHPNVPPTVKSDYNFYGGIYRYVWLHVTGPTYINEVFWTTPTVSDQQVETRIQSQIVNTASRVQSLTLVQEIFSPHNVLVARISSPIVVKPNETLSVDQLSEPLARPQLWSPDTPNLYRLFSSLRDGEHAIDEVENPLGFRWYHFDPQRGLIWNGRRVQIQGTNWHQVYPGMGNALPKSRHREDMKMMRQMGANFWRTSHYPHDPATLEASDQLGLMVWEELPVNKEVGQLDEYVPNVLQMAEEMIRRDRNHPSIIVWGLAGEVNAPLATAKRVVEAVARKYRALDPTRPVAMHSPGSDEIEAIVDVVGLDVSKETDSKHASHPYRPYMTAEYSIATIGRGIYGLGPQSEDGACLAHEKYLSQLNQRPWMSGGAIWHQYDYDGETYDTVVPHVVSFGMTDVWRIPKDVYYFYQSQWSGKPMVHIVGHWTWPGEEGHTIAVKVYSTAEEVELFLNGGSLGRKRPVRYPGLSHPPFLWKVKYEPGTLAAVGTTGSDVVRDERKTAGRPHRIALYSSVTRLHSGDPESLTYIDAHVVDKHDVVVPSSNHPITFTLYGPGDLLKQSPLDHGVGWTWNAVAGQTRVALRSNGRSGTAMVSAYSPGLGLGRIELELAAKGKPNEMDYIS